MEISFLYSFVIVSLCYDVLADRQMYEDMPDDEVVEMLTNYIKRQQQQLPPVPSKPSSEFSFEYPAKEDDSNRKSSFAVNPSNIRYYEDAIERDVAGSSRIEQVVPVEEKPIGGPSQDGPFYVSNPVASNANPGSVVNDESEKASKQNLTSKVNTDDEYGPIKALIPEKNDVYFVAIVSACTASAVLVIALIGFSWYRLQKNAKAAADVEYPAYGVTGPNKEVSPTGDRRLAQSAQMYHYQHQKQQIIAMESQAANDRHGSVSEAESEEENEENDYTVYECPGLASTGEMEVKNPLFQDDATPATPAVCSNPTKEKPTNPSPTKK